MDLPLHLISSKDEETVAKFITNLYQRNKKSESIAKHFLEIMKILEIDVGDPEYEGTPLRVGRYLYDFCIGYDPGNTNTTFENFSTDQMVGVKRVPYWSLCGHHFLPFRGTVSVGYIAQEKVIGLSKIPRIIKKYARGPQMQERFIHQIADDVESKIPGCLGVAVYSEAEHTCMQMRGIESDGVMFNSVVRGAFERQETKDEFLAIVLR